MVLAKDGIDFKKHAGVIAYFQKEYIKQENLIKSILNIYRQLFKLETTVITVFFYCVKRRCRRTISACIRNAECNLQLLKKGMLKNIRPDKNEE